MRRTKLGLAVVGIGLLVTGIGIGALIIKGGQL